MYCEAKKEENIRIFSSDLNSLVRETRFTLMTLRNVVRDPVLISSETMSLVALERIKGLTYILSCKYRGIFIFNMILGQKAFTDFKIAGLSYLYPD